MGSEQKRAFIAVILSGVILFTWQMYFAPKQPVVVEKEISKTVPREDVRAKGSSNEVTPGSNSEVAPKQARAFDVKSYTLSNGEHEITLRNDLAVSNIKGPNTKFPFKSIGGTDLPIKIQVLLNNQASDLLFNFQKVSETSLKGEDSKFGVKLTLDLNNDGKVKFSFNSEKPLRYRFLFSSEKKDTSK